MQIPESSLLRGGLYLPPKLWGQEERKMDMKPEPEEVIKWI